MDRTARLRLLAAVDLYPVISSEFTGGRDVLDILRAVLDGGARMVQLREKNRCKKELYRLALEYRRLTAASQALLIINDHLDVALASGADGVHLGQDDLPLEAALAVPGADVLLLGRSTHSLAQALEAAAAGAAYVNLGPLYPTQTKQLTMDCLGDAIVGQAAGRLPIPFTVMGGIKERHLPKLLSLGARKIAMVTEVTMAPDVAAQVRKLRAYWGE